MATGGINDSFVYKDGVVGPVELVPLGGTPNASGVMTGDGGESTTPCSNEYCLDDDDYVDMIKDYIYPTYFEWVLISFYVIVFVVGLIGNFLVCFVVFRNQSMRTVTNYFIVNLSVADLLVILICLPPTVIDDVTETWFIGSTLCKIVKYLQSVSISVSVLTLTVISMERFYAICHPLTFKSTTTRTRIIILLIWAVSLLMLVPELVVLDTQQSIPQHLNVTFLTSCKPIGWEYTSQMAYQQFLVVAIFFLPLGIMAFAYIRIAMCLWSNAVPTETSSCNNKSLAHGEKTTAQAQLISRRKVAKMLIAVVVMFGVCYLPVHLLNIFRYAEIFSQGKGSAQVPLVYFALIAHWLCYFNSAINPVIYNFMSENFRNQFKRVLYYVTCYTMGHSVSERTRIIESRYPYKASKAPMSV